MRRIAALVTAFIIGAALTTLPPGQGAAAQSTECARAVLGVPIETLPLPKDSYWDVLGPDTYGSGWNGDIVTADAADPEAVFTTSVGLQCVPDAALLMRRIADVDPNNNRSTKIEVAPIGDESYASMDAAGSIRLIWRHGKSLGEAYGYEVPGIGPLEVIAAALDDLLP